MRIYDMLNKDFINIPKWSMTPNHLMIMDSVADARFIAGLRSADSRIWSYCIIELMSSKKGKLAVCSLNKIIQDIYFEISFDKEHDIKYNLITDEFMINVIEMFLDKNTSPEFKLKRSQEIRWTQEEEDQKNQKNKGNPDART